MNRALITGSAGFIGSRLTTALNKIGYSVVQCDPRHAHGQEFQKFATYFHAPFDRIYHLAANIKPIDQRLAGGIAMLEDIGLDLEFTKWVEKNPPKECLVMMATGAADAWDTDPYAFCKLVTERLARVLHQQGVPLVVLKPFAGYAVDQAEGYPFRAILDRALRHEDPLTVWGSTETVRDWIHVDDLIRALVQAPEIFPHSPVPVELGTGRSVKFGELARMMADAVGYSPKIEAVADKPTSGRYRVADTTRASLYGFKAERQLEDVIREAVVERAVMA